MRRISFLKKYSNINLSSFRFKDFNSQRSIFFNNNIFKNELNNRFKFSIRKIDSLPYFIKKDNYIKNIRNIHFKSLNLLNNTDYENKKNISNNLIKIKEYNSFIENDIFLILNGKTDLINKSSNKKLDDFFMARLSTRSLIDQFLNIHSYKSSNAKLCNFNNILNNVCKEVNGMSSFYYQKNIIFNIKGKDKLNIFSLYPYLYYILIEIVKNSANAHLINNIDESIYINFYSDKDQFIIKILDKGLGFSKHDLNKVFTYSYTTNDDLKIVDEYELINQPLMNGFGFGLPLSRLYCKYLDGDMIVDPINGVGTEVTIIFKKNNSRENFIL
jgi:pyruvate dehydrogenase kinase 2/3/4